MTTALKRNTESVATCRTIEQAWEMEDFLFSENGNILHAVEQTSEDVMLLMMANKAKSKCFK